MVMGAAKMWMLANGSRYECKVCDYKSHNKSIYCRHVNTLSHWLCSDFAQYAPRDIKIVVASFLPLRKLDLCGKIRVMAFNYNLPLGHPWRMKVMAPVNPLARTVGGGDGIIRRKQTLVFVQQPW